MKGFFQLQRRFFSHALWREPRQFSRAEAWLDLLQLASYEANEHLVGNTLIRLEPGELVASVRFLSARWKWSKDKVASFWRMLAEASMIRTRNAQGVTVVTITNYERYNEGKDATRTETGHQPDTNRTRSGQTKEGKEGKKEEPPCPLAGDSPSADGSDPSAQKQRCLPVGWSKMTKAQRKRVRVLANTPLMERIGQFVGQKPSTLWTVENAIALKEIAPPPEEVDVVERYYLAVLPAGEDFRRLGLSALLNNWSEEVTRAIHFRSKNQ